MDWLNNLSEGGKKAVFGAVVVITLGVVSILLLRSGENVAVEPTPLPTSNRSTVVEKPEVAAPLPAVKEGEVAVYPNDDSDSNAGFTPPPEPVTSNEEMKETLDDLATLSDNGGLVDESKTPNDSVLNLVKVLGVKGAEILESPLYAPSDRHNNFSRFLTEWSTIPGEGFNVANPSTEASSTFVVVDVPYVSYSSIILEIENSSRPGEFREMELVFDGSVWKVLRYHDKGYSVEELHSH